MRFAACLPVQSALLRRLNLPASLVLLAALASPIRAELPPLVPREVLFGNPVRASPGLSPDGKRLAYVAPDAKAVSNVWIRTWGQHDDRVVTHDTHQGIYGFDWAPDGRHLLYEQDAGGDENLHLFSVDLDGGLVRDLTPFQGIRVQNVFTNPRRPGEVLAGLNLRDRRVFDIYRIDLATGAVTPDTQNPGDVLSWTTDGHGVIRAATAFDDTGRTIVRVRAGRDAPWRDLMVCPFDQCSFWGQCNGGSLVVGFSGDGQRLTVVDPLHADRTRLVELDTKTGREIGELASDPRCDVDYRYGATARPIVLTDPKTDRVQAVGFTYTKFEWKVVDPAVRGDFDYLARAHPGTLFIDGRDQDDRRWLVQYTTDDGPTAWYLYDRSARKTEPLFVDRPELAKVKLAKSRPVVIRSRDGLDLVSYLTLPPGVPARGLPLILNPHGGPWFRDRWGFDPLTQLLANRGYAVLQVNFRASVGFGRKFFNAANHQFGDGAVLGDLVDSIGWAVAQGIADPRRVAIMGGSFGGYATLCGITFKPEHFACAVDLVGPSNLRTLFASMPTYWKPIKLRWVLRMGDVEHDDALNRRLSPLFHLESVRAPLLIGHGANDPRVHLSESEQMVHAMRARGLPVTLVVYPDEGHGFNRPENNLDFFGRVEEFLAKHLGGRCEPWRKVPGATAEVR